MDIKKLNEELEKILEEDELIATAKYKGERNVPDNQAKYDYEVTVGNDKITVHVMNKPKTVADWAIIFITAFPDKLGNYISSRLSDANIKVDNDLARLF